MKRIIACVGFLLLLNISLTAQDKWDLKKCVDYAIANNISVKQQDLQVRFAQLDHEQDKGLQLPTFNWGVNTGFNFGLSENPTTGVLQRRSIFTTTAGLQTGLDLFNWFSIKNTIAASELTVEANRAKVAKVQNDIALNVAVAYLQILMSKEQVNIAEVQVLQTKTQLDVVRKKVNAGTLPELNAAELEAQLAVDSSTLITAHSAVQQFILQMKALLNLDAAMPFDVTTPPVDRIPVESLADLQPETVYNLAVANLPQQRVNELLIQSASKTVDAAHGRLYPNISFFGNLNSRYAAFKVPTYSQVISGYQTTSLRADAGGGTYLDVQSPILTQGGRTGYFKSDPLATQLSDNFGQGFGIGIQVPILNGNRARINWNRSKLSVVQLQLQNEQDKQVLKQDIYKAYTDATSAIEKYNASRKTVAAAEKAASFAQKRYDVNLISTYDLLNTQSRVFRARIEMTSAQFDYVFKMKLLEFYKGQGLRLE